jgi:hypothetical protein
VVDVGGGAENEEKTGWGACEYKIVEAISSWPEGEPLGLKVLSRAWKCVRHGCSSL